MIPATRDSPAPASKRKAKLPASGFPVAAEMMPKVGERIRHVPKTLKKKDEVDFSELATR
jgi:hypothetical protein